MTMLFDAPKAPMAIISNPSAPPASLRAMAGIAGLTRQMAADK
jgi:hypothetical protein